MSARYRGGKRRTTDSDDAAFLEKHVYGGSAREPTTRRSPRPTDCAEPEDRVVHIKARHAVPVARQGSTGRQRHRRDARDVTRVAEALRDLLQDLHRDGEITGINTGVSLFMDCLDSADLSAAPPEMSSALLSFRERLMTASFDPLRSSAGTVALMQALVAACVLFPFSLRQ